MTLLKKFLISVLIIAVVAFAASRLLQKKQQPVVQKDPTYKFYYYPQLNTYYDFTTNSFYYSVDGGETWIIKKPTEPGAAEQLGEKITLYNASPEIWQDNALHVQQYNGTLVDYSKEVEVAVAQPVKQDTTQEIAAVEKPAEVKGKFLKKFRQKVKDRFGKKDQ